MGYHISGALVVGSNNVKAISLDEKLCRRFEPVGICR